MPPTNLNYIELPATDLVAAKTFYEDHFGWTFTYYGPTYAAAHVSGVEVGLSTEATVSAAQPNGSQSSTGPLLLLETDDLAAAHSALSTDGAVIVTSPFDYPGGTRLHSAIRAATSWVSTNPPAPETRRK